MNSQLLSTVSQIHQQELRQAASQARTANQARATSQPKTRTERSRRFRLTLRAPRSAPAISAHAGTV
jgi:hypothetical protein